MPFALAVMSVSRRDIRKRVVDIFERTFSLHLGRTHGGPFDSTRLAIFESREEADKAYPKFSKVEKKMKLRKTHFLIPIFLGSQRRGCTTPRDTLRRRRDKRVLAHSCRQ
jgi:hypothetical protein